MNKYNPFQALRDGFFIDTSCYPWFAYKGARFNPRENKNVLTFYEWLSIEAYHNKSPTEEQIKEELERMDRTIKVYNES